MNEVEVNPVLAHGLKSLAECSLVQTPTDTAEHEGPRAHCLQVAPRHLKKHSAMM